MHNCSYSVPWFYYFSLLLFDQTFLRFYSPLLDRTDLFAFSHFLFLLLGLSIIGHITDSPCYKTRTRTTLEPEFKGKRSCSRHWAVHYVHQSFSTLHFGNSVRRYIVHPYERALHVCMCTCRCISPRSLLCWCARKKSSKLPRSAFLRPVVGEISTRRYAEVIP